MKYLLLVLCFLIPSLSFAQKYPTVASVNLFNKIATCESGYNPIAKNPYSTASGIFQFLDGTWKRYGEELWSDDYYTKNKLNENDSIELGWYVFTKYGTNDWLASKSCWGNYHNTS